MFVGMEHITLSNHELADEALNAAYSMCSTDPLLINERGVMAFLHGECVMFPGLPPPTAETLPLLSLLGMNVRRGCSQRRRSSHRLRRPHKKHGRQCILTSGLVTASCGKSFFCVVCLLRLLESFVRRFQEAKTAYRKVLEVEPRSASALGFLGITNHLLGDTNAAILNYHEVRSELFSSLASSIFVTCK
jgi:anaphase-promoting complex subunit 6